MFTLTVDFLRFDLEWIISYRKANSTIKQKTCNDHKKVIDLYFWNMTFILKFPNRIKNLPFDPVFLIGVNLSKSVRFSHNQKLTFFFTVLDLKF